MSTGVNANTSGSAVANVGWLPKGVLEKLTGAVGIVWKNLVKVVKGEAVIATVDYTVKGGSDLLPNRTLEEIARRLIVTLELKAQGNVVFSPTPPDDKSKVWWKTDPTTGIPLGSPKTWNSTTNQWQDVQTQASAYVPPKRRHTMLFADAGQSQGTARFDSIQTTDYMVVVTPTTLINGSWQPAPSTFPTHFGYCIVNKAEAELTINFFGTPDQGMTFEIDIEERV